MRIRIRNNNVHLRLTREECRALEKNLGECAPPDTVASRFFWALPHFSTPVHVPDRNAAIISQHAPDKPCNYQTSGRCTCG